MFEDLFEQCWESIYAVFAGNSFGTAFAARQDGYLATALHVVAEAHGVPISVMQTVMGASPNQRPIFSA